MNQTITLRQATDTDAPQIHRLIAANLEAGHLLPRTFADVEAHVSRFIVADCNGAVVGCAELAPLSDAVAEIRSLVVDQAYRGQHIGARLVAELSAAASGRGYATLCAFTHDPAHFVRLGFTIVPHIWVPEKIAHDCTSCSLFRRCGQYAVTLPLRAGVSVRPERPAALIPDTRTVAPRRPAVERLQLRGVDSSASKEAVPA
jgi:amino-acid N-acetyltransferase